MVQNVWARKQTGFTIVELLIVIVVIAILAAITVVAYNGVQDRARASSLAQGLKQVEKAFALKATADAAATYWPDNSFGYGGNPTISTLISNTNLKDYVQRVPTPSGMTGLDWRYDYDSDLYNGCSASASGVNIIIYNVNSYVGVINQLDSDIDDGNASCGKVRYVPSDNGGVGAIFYSLSADGTI